MDETKFLEVVRQNDVAIVYLDRPPVNALSGAMRTALYETVEALQFDAAISIIVLTTHYLPFSAGADITEFSQGYLGKTFLDLYHLFSSSSKPIVAGIRHYALGGGLELAMLCHHRVVLKPAKLGQPEIKLGIIPGGTGTQSLPRLVGMEKACEMILSGEPITGKQGLLDGLVDVVTERELEHACIEYVKKMLRHADYEVLTPLHRGLPEAPEEGFFAAKREKIVQKSYGFQAPEVALSCLEASLTMPVDKALAFEAKAFMDLMTGPASHAMRYQFMAAQMARQVTGIDKGTQTQQINQIGIVGGGLMGSGIALACASRGFPVILVEASEQALRKCMENIDKYYKDSVHKGKFSQKEATSLRAKIKVMASMSQLAEVDCVIEAVFEDLAVKKAVFAELDTICKPECIFASNTSAIDLNVIAAACQRPQKVVGMHFFSPAQVMRLLEVVRGDKTSVETLATVLQLAKKLKKTAVTVGVCPGFVGNRMVIRYFQQVEQLLLEGVKPEEIDAAIQNFGFAMGPCAMADMSGLDISVHMMPGDTIAKALVDAGRLGQKSGRGFYDYQQGSHHPAISSEAQNLIRDYAKKRGVEPKSSSEQDIVDRCVLALINEGAHIVSENIVARASDIDVVYVQGYGFPTYRGGPMFYADTLGLDKVRASIRKLAKQYPSLWQESAFLSKMLKKKTKLSQSKAG